MTERKSSMDVKRITAKAAERVLNSVARRYIQASWNNPSMPLIQYALANVNEAIIKEVR